MDGVSAQLIHHVVCCVLQAQYAELLLRLRGQQMLSKELASFVLLLSGNIGYSIHEKGCDVALQARMKNQLEGLADKLGLPPGDLPATCCRCGAGHMQSSCLQLHGCSL